MDNLWVTTGAPLLDGIKRLYHYSKHGNTGDHPMTFDHDVPTDELYDFIRSKDFEIYFFKIVKHMDQVVENANKINSESKQDKLEEHQKEKNEIDKLKENPSQIKFTLVTKTVDQLKNLARIL